MAKGCYLLFLGALSTSAAWLAAQERGPNITTFHVTVNMVQLDVAVTDKKGDYVTHLSPWDFTIYEDGIRQEIAAFGEENEPPRKLDDFKRGQSVPTLAASLSAQNPRHGRDLSSAGPSGRISPRVAGASIFVLFDTSNYMYRGFVFAQDAIAEFLRSTNPADRLAFYSYSRDLSRACPLTSDRSEVSRAVRTTVAGDDAALYNSLMLTLRDAAKFSGRRAVVVFSNGPDNASAVAPEDVREFAQTEGIPLYMVSTMEARLDPLSTAVFERISSSTGGKAYFASHWTDQQKAFASIQDDLAHLYSISYYPRPNPNRGWRTIMVKLVGENLKQYHVRARSGYRPRAVRVSTQAATAP
jgi:VWFA-related protein